MKRVVLWLAAMSLLISGTASVTGAEREVRIVTLGDSITRGVRTGVKADETFAALLQKALRNKGINATVINVGIGGERTDGALSRLDKVLELKPQVVTIMYGTNDSYVDKGKNKSRLSVDEYARNLTELVERVRRAGGIPVLMTEPRWGAKGKDGLGENPNGRLEPYLDACRRVARATQSPLVDHYAQWTKAEKAGVDIGAAWTTDECHPNGRGHRELTAALLPIFLKILQQEKANRE